MKFTNFVKLLVLITAFGYVACTTSPNPKISYTGKRGVQVGEFNEPIGIAVDNKGVVYVVDSRNARLQKYYPETDKLEAVSLDTRKWPFLTLPIDVGISPIGIIYIADFESDRIFKFTGQGELLSSWGGAGKEPGLFQAPSDFYNHRIQVFDENGKFLKVIGSHGSYDSLLNYPTDIAVDNQNRIYLADAYNHKIKLLGYLLDSTIHNM